MPMFPMVARDFNEDPFLSGPMESMRRMETMMDSMMSPFGGMFGDMGMIDNRPHMRAGQNHNSLMPFGFGRSLFPSMDRMFSNFAHMSQDPNCHSFSSSSVMTYTTDETGTPQMYQATSSTRTAPGGVKETRESVQDSRSGLQKMAIGHHLDDKGHVVEKKKFRYTGEEEENHEFINLEDEEADTFDQEWQQRAQSFHSGRMQAAIGPASSSSSRWRERSPEPEVLAITDGSHHQGNYAAENKTHSDNKEGKKKVGFLKKKKHHHSSSSHRSAKHE